MIFGALVYPLVEWGRPTLIIVSAMCVYLLASLAALRWIKTLRGMHLNGAASNLAAGIAALLLMWFEGVFAPVGALIVSLVIVFCFTLLRLPMMFAAAATIPTLTVAGFMLMFGPPFELPVVQVAALLSITGTLAVAAYLLESATRRDFFLRRVIADRDKELEAAKAKQLGQYTLVERIGQGGMGVVYKARHALLRRPTAIKLLPVDDAPERLERFEREVQLTSELTHPNIVAVYDYGRSPEGEFYYAMEYLPGIDLQSIVERYGPLSASRAIPILVQVCSALADAHDRGLIHRDVKPANVILSRFGRRTDVVKVVDFGLVKEVKSEDGLTAENVVAGTPAYMAPETLTNPDDVGASSDLYAVGCVGFFLLTGRTVFEGKTFAEICGHHIHSEPPAPSSLSEQPVPTALDDALLRCLAKDPAARFPDAATLAQSLMAIETDDGWTDDRALEWWVQFEAERETERPEPISRDHALTVDLRERA